MIALIGITCLLILGLLISANTQLPSISSVHEIVIQLRPPTNNLLFFGVLLTLFGAVVIYSLPFPLTGLASLTLGALYGAALGFTMALTSSTCAAIILFYIGRYVGKDWVNTRFGRQTEFINQMINDNSTINGTISIITVRWIPGIPFFLLNCLLGLTNISAQRFLISSLMGLSIPTFIIVYAGSMLGQIASFDEILKPSVFITLFVLGASPLALHAIAKLLKK